MKDKTRGGQSIIVTECLYCVLLYTDFAARCQQEHTSCEFIMEQAGRVWAIMLMQIVILTYFHLTATFFTHTLKRDILV